MIDHNARYGNFTSSQIGKLMSVDRKGAGFGKPALTYIKSRGMERRLKRSIQNESSSRETSWGTLVEGYAFSLLDMSYKIVSTDTVAHPKYPFWKGSPDGVRFGEHKAVIEQKCPFTLLSFCTIIDALEAGGIEQLRAEHDKGDDWYYQCVSNAILTDSTEAELIIFCPYKSELDAIRLLAMEAPPEQAPDYRWLDYAHNKELPYLNEKGEYKNLNIFRFPVPQEDKEALTAAVIKAEEQLTPNPIYLITPTPSSVIVEGI